MFDTTARGRTEWARRWARFVSDMALLAEPKLRSHLMAAMQAAIKNNDDYAWRRLDWALKLLLRHQDTVLKKVVPVVVEAARLAGHKPLPEERVLEAVAERWAAWRVVRQGLIVQALRRVIPLARRIAADEAGRTPDDPEGITVRIEARVARNANAIAQAAAMTETHAASMAAQHMAVEDLGLPITCKTWAATHDHRTRPTHRAADGQTVDMDDPFMVGGYPLPIPGDSSMGAPPEEVVHCRCGVVYTVGEQ